MAGIKTNYLNYLKSIKQSLIDAGYTSFDAERMSNEYLVYDYILNQESLDEDIKKHVKEESIEADKDYIAKLDEDILNFMINCSKEATAALTEEVLHGSEYSYTKKINPSKTSELATEALYAYSYEHFEKLNELFESESVTFTDGKSSYNPTTDTIQLHAATDIEAPFSLVHEFIHSLTYENVEADLTIEDSNNILDLFLEKDIKRSSMMEIPSYAFEHYFTGYLLKNHKRYAEDVKAYNRMRIRKTLDAALIFKVYKRLYNDSLNGVKIDARKINEVCNDMVALGLNPVHVAEIMNIIIKIFKDIDLDAALGASPYESLYTHAVSDILGYYLFYKTVESEDKAYLDTITTNLFNMSKEDVFEYLGLVKNAEINKEAVKEMQKVYTNNVKKFW